MATMEKLRELLNKCTLTQRAIADQSGVGLRTISRIACGEHVDGVKAQTLDKLNQFLTSPAARKKKAKRVRVAEKT